MAHTVQGFRPVEVILDKNKKNSLTGNYDEIDLQVVCDFILVGADFSNVGFNCRRTVRRRSTNCASHAQYNPSIIKSGGSLRRCVKSQHQERRAQAKQVGLPKEWSPGHPAGELPGIVTLYLHAQRFRPALYFPHSRLSAATPESLCRCPMCALRGKRTLHQSGPGT